MTEDDFQEKNKKDANLEGSCLKPTFNQKNISNIYREKTLLSSDPPTYIAIYNSTDIENYQNGIDQTKKNPKKTYFSSFV